MTEKHSQIDDILNYSDGVYLTVNHEWIITYTNQLSESLLKIPAENLIDSDLRETLPDIVSVFYKTLSRSLRKQESCQITARYGPTQKILELRSVPTKSGLLAIFHDVTSREENLIAIRDSEIRQQAIFKTLSDALITIDDKGTITSCNPAATKIFGYQASELLGVNVSVLMPKEERKAHEEYTAYSNLNENRILNQYRELYGLRKDSSKFPIELNVAPMHVGGNYGYMAIIRDITERKNFLDSISHEKNIAEKASEAKSKFLDSMSHELHTPLNAIIGYSQLLEMNPNIDTEHKVQIAEIHKAGKHLLELVEGVLNFTQIDTGDINICSQVVSLEDLLVQCLAILSSLIKEKNINLRVHPDCYHYLLQADPVRLKQVFVNIISNAVKYNSENGKITINCKVDDNNRLKVTISDTGSGIDASRLDEVFEPFNRLANEGSDIPGTGIGLSITKQLVESMDGNIGVESAIDEGSKFWVELPLANVS